MLKEKASDKKKTARSRILIVLIAIGLVISVVFGFRLMPETIRTVTHHYPGANFVTALRGYHDAYYTYNILIKKFQPKCHMISKDEDGFQLWDTPEGQYWMPAGNTQNYWVSVHLSEMDRKIYTSGNQTICPGDIVIDCGAHVGFFVRAALKAGAGLVVAIEIAPLNLTCLKRNFYAEISSGKVIIYEKGVWDRDAHLDLNLFDNSGHDSVVFLPEQGKRSIKVALTTLDKIVNRLRLQRVDFVKMDVEGSEQNALKGAAKTLRKFKPKLSVAVYHLRRDLEVIPALIRQIRPDYQVECGPIFTNHNGSIVPEIMYFR
jgi:FkbM family methyltransferase